MVHDEVWTGAGMEKDGGYLCIGCLEKRLSRRLTPADCQDVVINAPPGRQLMEKLGLVPNHHSTRLADRLRYQR